MSVRMRDVGYDGAPVHVLTAHIRREVHGHCCEHKAHTHATQRKLKGEYTHEGITAVKPNAFSLRVRLLPACPSCAAPNRAMLPRRPHERGGVNNSEKKRNLPSTESSTHTCALGPRRPVGPSSSATCFGRGHNSAHRAVCHVHNGHRRTARVSRRLILPAKDAVGVCMQVRENLAHLTDRHRLRRGSRGDRSVV